jgi:hypothetical protein
MIHFYILKVLVVCPSFFELRQFSLPWTSFLFSFQIKLLFLGCQMLHKKRVQRSFEKCIAIRVYSGMMFCKSSFKIVCYAGVITVINAF